MCTLETPLIVFFSFFLSFSISHAHDKGCATNRAKKIRCKKEKKGKSTKIYDQDVCRLCAKAEATLINLLDDGDKQNKIRVKHIDYTFQIKVCNSIFCFESNIKKYIIYYLSFSAQKSRWFVHKNMQRMSIICGSNCSKKWTDVRQCQGQFTNSNEQLDSASTAPKRTYECYICQKQCSSNSCCNRHIKSVHCPPVFTCKCTKTFLRSDDFEAHTKRCASNHFWNDAGMRFQTRLMVICEKYSHPSENDKKKRKENLQKFRAELDDDLADFIVFFE